MQRRQQLGTDSRFARFFAVQQAFCAVLGAFWSNAFSPEAYGPAAERGPARPGDWVAERRNPPADFRRIVDRELDRLDCVWVMTDGERTGALVEGWYGDISVTTLQGSGQ